MKVLAIETATSICSVALACSGNVHIERDEGRGIHSEAMFRMIQDLLAGNSLSVSDLDAVLVSRGPGQYTGLRIAASGVKGLLFRQPVPLWSLGTLEGFAAAGLPESGESISELHAVLDARRHHLYHQKFDYVGGEWTRTPPAIRPLEELAAGMRPGSRVVGTGISRLEFTETAAPERIPERMLSAGALLAAWQSDSLRHWFRREDPARFEPEYLGSGAPRRSG